MTATLPRFALASRRVVVPGGAGPAAILIEGERIADVVAPSSVPSSFPLEDLGHLVIAPGVIDAHVHINEPGRTDWEGFETATRAAAAGGITMLVDMPLNSSPVTTTRSALDAKRVAASGKCWVDVGFYGGLIPGNSNHVEGLLHAGALGIKAFLCDSGLPEFPAASLEDLKAAMPLLARRNRPLLVHAELCETPAPAPRDVRSYHDYLASRPPEWEAAAIRELIALCRWSRCAVHVVHLANADALPMLQAAREEGLPITVETCPHYLHFTADEVPAGDTRFKCAPPIRDRSHRERLWDGLKRGVIDTIGSDHSPCPPDMKRLDSGDFPQAWGGIASLQLTLPLVWTGAVEREISLNQVFGWLSEGPARLLRLDGRKGRLAAGYDADLVVWDPDARWTVHGDQMQHRHKLTPYDSAELIGRVHRTYVRGSLIYDVNKSIAAHLNQLDEAAWRATLSRCCAARAWVESMSAVRPFASDEDVFRSASEKWWKLRREDWLEAFAAHPQIGDIDSLRAKFADTRAWAGGEQAGVAGASEATLRRLAEANREYLARFGYIFIVFATGKSADEMLAILQQRLLNSPEDELPVAAAEQLKITHLRLRKLVS